MKTLVLRSGSRMTIRAIAVAAEDGGRDKCAVLRFFQEQASSRKDEMDKLAALLTETADNGPPKNETKFRYLPGTDGLYEFKTSGGLRLMCFWDDRSLIICTHGYTKGSQKAPKQELQRAKNLKSNYFEAKTTGNLNHG